MEYNIIWLSELQQEVTLSNPKQNIQPYAPGGTYVWKTGCNKQLEKAQKVRRGLHYTVIYSNRVNSTDFARLKNGALDTSLSSHNQILNVKPLSTTGD